MRELIIPVIFFLLTASCSRATESDNSVNYDSATAIDSAIIELQHPIEIEIQETFPDFVKNLVLPDSLLIDLDNVIYGDFNGDQKEDFASIVTNLQNGFQGVLLIHNNDKADYLVFGAGQVINGMDNLNWIDIFKTLPIGEVIAPTMVNAETGDIIGPDKSKEFRLIGNGIYMHVDEAGGGGILFWTGEKYEWYHIE